MTGMGRREPEFGRAAQPRRVEYEPVIRLLKEHRASEYVMIFLRTERRLVLYVNLLRHE